MSDFINSLWRKIINNKVVVQNMSYLSMIQIFNMALPFVTYPYLIRILGAELYGSIVFAQVIIGYFVVFVGFGFNISATKEISIHKDDKDKLAEIVSSIFLIKSLLFVLSIIALMVIIQTTSIGNGIEVLLYLTMWMCLYEVVFPQFFFQGIEKMKYITYLTLISRSVSLILIFYLIRFQSDYLKVPIINSIGVLLVGFFSLILMKKEGVVFRFPQISVLYSYLKKSYVMALAYASNALKTNINLTIIKFLFSFTEVAYFDLAVKITNIFTAFLDIISQAIFPKMSRENNKIFLNKVIRSSLLLSVIFVFALLIFSDLIIEMLGGEMMMPASNLLRILSLNLPIYIWGALLGRNCLIVNGEDKSVLLSMFYSGLLYILIIGGGFIWGYGLFSMSQLAFVYIFSFGFESLFRYSVCRRKRLII